MKILGVIPARYASTRFPGKPLVDIAGRSMINRVYHQCKQVVALSDVLIATDDDRIFNHVLDFGGKVMLTSSAHQSGTDRCAEVAKQLKEEYDVIINIQGDEPFIDPEQITQLCNCFTSSTVEIATLIKKIDATDDLFNHNKPKVVKSIDNFALYFSRNAIPVVRGTEEAHWLAKHVYYKHIGIYGYRATVLEKITQLPLSQLEKAEGLEQLRWLENGYSIKVAETAIESMSIDTPEDLQKVLDGLP